MLKGLRALIFYWLIVVLGFQPFAHASEPPKNCPYVFLPTIKEKVDFALAKMNGVAIRFDIPLNLASFSKFQSRKVVESKVQAELKEIANAVVHSMPLKDFVFNLDTDPLHFTLLRTRPHWRTAFRQAIAQAVASHPASKKNRAEILTELYERGKEGSGFFNNYVYYDEILGLDRNQIEKNEREHFDSSQAHLLSGVGKDHNDWFTSHSLLIHLLAELKKFGTRSLVDIGSGTGRLGLLAGFLFPDIRVVGIEVYQPRVESARKVAKRFGFEQQIQFRQQDLMDMTKPIPMADVYYIMGPTNDKLVNQTIGWRLEEPAQHRRILIISKTIQAPIMTEYLQSQSWLSTLRDWNFPKTTAFISHGRSNDAF